MIQLNHPQTHPNRILTLAGFPSFYLAWRARRRLSAGGGGISLIRANLLAGFRGQRAARALERTSGPVGPDRPRARDCRESGRRSVSPVILSRLVPFGDGIAVVWRKARRCRRFERQGTVPPSHPFRRVSGSPSAVGGGNGQDIRRQCRGAAETLTGGAPSSVHRLRRQRVARPLSRQFR